MIERTMRMLLLSAALLVSVSVMAQALQGQPAPAFALTDLAGKLVQLADFRGRYVVLEWTNPSCPFVQKHYMSGNMQSLQKRYTGQGVAWLVVNSTAASHAEFVSPAQQAAWLGKQGAAPTAAMLDPDGKVGRVYGARTTPHMYVIDPNGKLIYAGAIDDKRSADPADVKTARNYVAQALDEARAGKPVSIASTPAYGCSVKYAD
jgi:peroxiredoxin